MMQPQQPRLYIRMNQVGFLTDDIKSAIILSESSLRHSSFTISNNSPGEIVYTGKIEARAALNSDFPFTYFIDFSAIDSPGTYTISVDGLKSEFKIENNIYNSVLDSLLLFFKAQRCGYTDPLFHFVCHPYDATSVIDGKDTINIQYDVTGGWHDAGDYIKFLNTAAYTTYTLMFAYEFDSLKFGFDYNRNNVPDILEEAKIGLDWLLRLQYRNKFITQVQDLRDHEQGWRKPDSDKISYDRPGFTGIGKNTIGIYSAVMASAARIWKTKIKYHEFAHQCLTAALSYYEQRKKVPDLDIIESGMYQDNKFTGKLALAAVELFLTTGNQDYLKEASLYADSAKSDYWWSWGDINSFAHYKLAKVNPRFKSYIQNTIEHLRKVASKKLFNESAGDSWGSNTALLGTILQIILLNDLEQENSFRDLLYSQRDFIFGRNQWGITFINGAGNNYPRHFHSQIAYFNNGNLPGAVAAGPISKEKFDKYKITLKNPDKYSRFQTKEAVYHDDNADWVTNEPTITSNATALFAIGYFAQKNR